MLAWIAATISPAPPAISSADPGRSVSSSPTAPANAPPSIIPSSEMLIVPGLLGDELTEAANSSTAAAITALRYALSLVAMSPSAERKSPMPAARVGGQRPRRSRT